MGYQQGSAPYGTAQFTTDINAKIKFGAAAALADGGTITHGYGSAPTTAIVIGSVANEIVAVTGLNATTITVAIKKRADGSAGTAQTVYWLVTK